MKRIALFIALIFLTSIVRAERSDLHLKRLIECINENNFSCANKELPQVKTWDYDPEIESHISIENALSYAEQLKSDETSSILADSLLVYVGWEACEQYYDKSLNGDYAAAIQYIQMAYSLFSKVQGQQGHGYAYSLCHIGGIVALTGDFDTAENMIILAQKMLKEYLGENHKHYQESVFQLSSLYYLKGEISKSLELILPIIDSYRAANNEKCIDYTSAMTLLAAIYAASGKPDEAIIVQKKNIEILKSLPQKYTFALANALSNLGTFYIQQGNYYHAKEVCELAVKYGKELHIETQSVFAIWQSVLGQVYLELGEYNNAEVELLEAAKLQKNIQGENTLEYARILHKIATLYFYIGNMQNAGNYTRSSLEILEQLNITHTTDYTAALTTLSRIFKAQKKLDVAISTVTKAIRIIEEDKDLKSDVILHANVLNTLGVLYSEIPDQENAEICYRKAIDLVSANPQIKQKAAVPLNNLGDVYQQRGDYKTAKQLYINATTLLKNTTGDKHIYYATALNNIAGICIKLEEYDEAQQHLMQSTAINKNNYIRSIEFMSERQREGFIQTVRSQFTFIVPYITYLSHQHSLLASNIAYDNELFFKGLLLQSHELIKRSIYESKNKDLLTQWNELTGLKQTIHHLRETDPTSVKIADYENQAEQLEKEITRSSAAYRENQRQWNITWNSVQADLKPNQVAIEYMSAPLNEDSTMYCALLLRDTCSHPILIPLFEEKQATALISDDEGETYSYNENGAALSALVWSKVLPYIKPGESLYFAPTGMLHQLAIEALPYDASRTMDDVFNLVRVSSTRELVLNHSSETHTSATLYGGIQYDLDATDMEAASRQYQGEQLLASRSFGAADINRGHANYLPGTKAEAEQIKKMLTRNHITARLYTDAAANEESFKALSGKHQNVLHIATHGFYWTDSTAHRQKYFTQHNTLMGEGQPTPPAIDPLNRCGLLFAGANIALQGYSDELPQGVQDGILTAKEISLLDLRDANLVVLSACETGKGEITGDGVFGLQRAFKMAGAQTIIMSLWPVNDEATQLLMTEFYRNWITLRQPKREAFRSARNTVRTRYKDPTYWAGFIMLN